MCQFTYGLIWFNFEWPPAAPCVEKEEADEFISRKMDFDDDEKRGDLQFPNTHIQFFSVRGYHIEWTFEYTRRRQKIILVTYYANL